MRIQDHRAASVEIDSKRVEARIVVAIRIKTIDFELLDPNRTHGGWPCPAVSDLRSGLHPVIAGQGKSLEQSALRYFVGRADDE